MLSPDERACTTPAAARPRHDGFFLLATERIRPSRAAFSSRGRFGELEHATESAKVLPKPKAPFTESRAESSNPTPPRSARHGTHPNPDPFVMRTTTLKTARATGTPRDEPSLDDDCFRCVLEAIGYSATLADCARLSKTVLPVAMRVIKEARSQAVRASGGLVREIDEEIRNRFELWSLGSHWAGWTVALKKSDDTRYVWMRDCERFVGVNFPLESVHALSPHLPVFEDDVRQSVYAAATLAPVPADLRSPDFRQTEIGVKLLTRDPGLQLFVSGVLEANLPNILQMFDAKAGRRFEGNFRCHARFVRWTLCTVLPAE